MSISLKTSNQVISFHFVHSKQFRDYEKLQDLKDSNRSLKWIILGSNLKRHDANRIASTFGLRNPHFIDDSGETTVLMEKPFYYQMDRVYYLDKAKYLD